MQHAVHAGSLQSRARRERARSSSLLLCACGRRPCVCEEGQNAVRITCGLTQAFPHPASESLCWRLIFVGKIFVAVQELAVLEEGSGTLTTEARYLFLLLGGAGGNRRAKGFYRIRKEEALGD